MFALLIPLLASIPGLIGKYFEQVNAIKAQELSNQLAIKQEQSKLIAQGIISQSELGQEQLKSTSPMFKQLIYCVMLSPVVITCFDPILGKQIFLSLGIVPEWYMALISTIGLAIWGINSDKLQSMITARREYKLESKRIVARKEYYDALRKTKGFVTPEDIKEMEPVFDALDRDNEANG